MAISTSKNVISIVSILSIILAIALGLYVSQRITKPLESLSKTVDEVSKGNFNVEVEQTSSIKEINVLAESLNRIMSSMKLAAVKEGILKEKKVKK